MTSAVDVPEIPERLSDGSGNVVLGAPAVTTSTTTNPASGGSGVDAVRYLALGAEHARSRAMPV